jgi:ferredoxin
MTETRETVLKVWIEPGCIVCNACESNCPEVFHVEVESSTIRPEAMNAEFLSPLSKAVRDAAAECPVEVIKFETAGGAE